MNMILLNIFSYPPIKALPLVVLLPPVFPSVPEQHIF